MATSPKELKDVTDMIQQCSKHVCELADKIDSQVASRLKKRQQVMRDLQKDKKEENR